VTVSQFAKGYQEALSNVLAVLKADGPEAAQTYIENNLQPTNTKEDQ
jgi:hypothetical protein